MLLLRRRPPRPILSFLLPALLFLAHPSRTVGADDDDDAAGPKENSANCTCYAVESGGGPTSNGASAHYFAHHRFWDFRALARSADQYGAAPEPVGAGDADAGAEDEVSAADRGYLNGSSWNADWTIQNWGKDASADFPVVMQNSPRNVYISQTNASDTGNADIEYPTYLTLRTVRLSDFQSAAEVENEQKNLMHASLRMRARVVGDAGAVAGFFTFYNDDNESDVEILTNDPPGVIRYTNQPSVKNGNDVPASSLQTASLPSWSDWQTHRIDWLPHRSNWYLDGALTGTNTYGVPRKPSGLVLNMWSDGGEWSGNMTVGGSALLQVQWVEMIFNTSGPVGGPGGGGTRRSRKKRRWDGEEDEQPWSAAGLARRWSAGADAIVGRWGMRSMRAVTLLQKRGRGKHCDIVCRVDGVEKVGYPEIAHVSSAAPAGVVPAVGCWALLGITAVVCLVIGL